MRLLSAVTEIRSALLADWEPLIALLEDAGLPTEDLSRETLQHFMVAVQGHALAGAVGLEVQGMVGLLRSLVVDHKHRNRRLGQMLLEAAEKHASQHGIKTLYLLTTTAEAFFVGRGYQVASRADAPPAIAGTRQFNSLCPATSSFMSKSIPSRQHVRDVGKQ